MRRAKFHSSCCVRACAVQNGIESATSATVPIAATEFTRFDSLLLFGEPAATASDRARGAEVAERRRSVVVCDTVVFPVAVDCDVVGRLYDLRSMRLQRLRKRAATVYVKKLLDVASSATSAGEMFCDASWLSLLVDLLHVTTRSTRLDILRVIGRVVPGRAPAGQSVPSCSMLFRQLCTTAVDSWWPQATLSQERRAMVVVTSMLDGAAAASSSAADSNMGAGMSGPAGSAEAAAVTRTATVQGTVHLARTLLLDAEWRAAMMMCFETALSNARTMCDEWVACFNGHPCAACGRPVLPRDAELGEFLARHKSALASLLLASLVAGGMTDAVVPGARVMIPSAAHGFCVGTVIAVHVGAGMAEVDVDGDATSWTAARNVALGARAAGATVTAGGVMKASSEGPDASGLTDDAPGVDTHVAPAPPPGAPSGVGGSGAAKGPGGAVADQPSSRVSLPIARVIPLGDGLVSAAAVPFESFLKVVLPLLSWSGHPSATSGGGAECACSGAAAAPGSDFVEAVCVMSHLRTSIFRALGAMLQDPKAAAVFLRLGALPVMLTAAVCTTADAAATATRAIKLSHTRERAHATVELATRLGARVDCVELQCLQRRVWDQASSLTFRAARGSSSAAQTLEAVCGDMHVCGGRVQAMSHFPTVRLAGEGVPLGTGVWFYEVLVLSGGLVQVGWGDPRMQCDPARGHGAGDDPYSWAYDGQRQRLWFGSSVEYGLAWRAGDAVGCWVDTRESVDAASKRGVAFRFALNGVDMGEAHVAFGVRSGLFPAASMEMHQVIEFNFGQRPFFYDAHAMPDCPAAKPIASFAATPPREDDASPGAAPAPGGEAADAPAVELRMLPSPECTDRSALLEALLSDGFPVRARARECNEGGGGRRRRVNVRIIRVPLRAPRCAEGAVRARRGGPRLVHERGNRDAVGGPAGGSGEGRGGCWWWRRRYGCGAGCACGRRRRQRRRGRLRVRVRRR
jgi:hypothetical protein